MDILAMAFAQLITNKYSQETLLIRVGLLMYLVIVFQAIKLFYLEPANWQHHLINVFFHGVCLLLSMHYLQLFRAPWCKFAIFICFTSYLVVACHLWQSDPAISYFVLLEIFVASLVFPNRENGSFTLLLLMLLTIYFYLQLTFSSATTFQKSGFYSVELQNHITLAVASVFCSVYLRFMVTANWRRVKHSNKRGVEIIDKLIPRRFQHLLYMKKQDEGLEGCCNYETDQCAIVSIDIVNSTELMLSMGDLIAQKEFNRIFHLIDEQVQVHNAHRMKTNGDQYLFAVGYDGQSSHSEMSLHDSSRTAIALAIKITKLVKQASDNYQFAIRIGIASGYVHSGLSSHINPDHDIWGETVVRCSRLENIALEDELVIDELTFNALQPEPSFAFSSGTRHLKGLGQTSFYRANAFTLGKAISKINTLNPELHTGNS